MEQVPGEGSSPDYVSVDKSKVLNIKPLRSLVPIFSSPPNLNSFSPPQAPSPFVCVPPSGPFPPGITPFFPFIGAPQTPQTTPISAAVPINLFQTPQTANGDAGSSRRASRGTAEFAEEDGYRDGQNQSSGSRFQKRTRGSQAPDIDTDLIVEDILKSYNLTDFDTFRNADGDKEAVGYILLIFNLLRRKIGQIEDSKEANSAQTKHPHLRAGTIVMNKGIRTNVKKRIGAVPGVEIGDIFFFRMELCVIGLHAPSMAGIDYMSLTISQEEEPLAVSIVSSGGYEDNVEDEDVLIYSGQGGNNSVTTKDRETVDQKLERGNLALEKSLLRGNEVRVIRGVKDFANPTGKVYVYDGLYRIQESWVEKGKSGSNIFKYKLVRLPGQPEGYKMWKTIQQWKDGITPRLGIILPDITSGAESIPVSLVNDIDDERGPAYFTYSPSLNYSKPVDSKEPSGGCACQGGCLPGNHNCPCIQKNGGYLPYAVNGILVSPKSIIHECGPSCQCPSSCRNRVSQGGLKVRLEVFKTKDKGWGLRSWDPIRTGAFICEYAGEATSDSEVQELGGENEGDHIFYGIRTYRPAEVMPGVSNEAPNLPFPLVISAKDAGNVARFMNHSCTPNVLWQPVLRANDKEVDLHIVFYAIRHIPPMMELTYSYGMVSPEMAEHGKKKCLCGSAKCRGFFY